MSYGGVEYAAGPYAGPESAAASAGTYPALAVEIAFTSAPGAAMPVWVDVTPDVRFGNTNRGRSAELDQFQAGTATITLANADRKYDPTYTAGPYYGYLLPMRRIRVRATFEGVTYPVFDGFVDSWDQQYDPGNNDAVAIVYATDAFKVLAAADLRESVYRIEVETDAPARWWRLDEPSGSTVIYDHSGNRHDGALLNSPTLAGTGLVDRDPGTSMSVIGGNTSGQGFWVDDIIQAAPSIGTGAFSVEFWMQCNPNNLDLAVARLFVQWDTASSLTDYIEISVRDSDGASPGLIDFRTGLLPFALSSVRVDDNVRHHVVCVRDASGTLTVYVDGVAGTPGTGTVRNITSAPIYVGSNIGAGAFSYTGSLQHVAIYTSALSAARIAAHNAAGRTPWDNDAPGTRVGRVLDEIDWPTALRQLDTGSSSLQTADIEGVSALEHIQKAADSEFGSLFMARDGSVRLIGRTGRINRPEYATFGDGAGEIGYQSLDLDYSDQLVRNSVTVSRNEGKAQRSEDATSVTSFLRHSHTVDGLLHDDDTLSRDAADFLVSEYKDAKLRITSMTLAPRGNPTTLFPQVLGRELGDEVTVKRRPQGVGDPISQASVIEGITHSFGPKHWETAWALSPAFAGAFLQLDLTSGPGLDSLRLYF